MKSVGHGRLLLRIAGLIYRTTSEAWRRVRGSTEFGDLRAEIRLLREEVARFRAEGDLLRGRLARIDAAHRPHYPRAARFDVLWHIRRWGISVADASRTFVLSPSTIGRWLADVESGRSALARPAAAIRRLPDLTRELVRRLILEQADWGSRRICGVLVRLGAIVSRRSVQRIKREGPPNRPRPQPDRTALGRPVVAKHADHVWLADLTTVSLLGLRTLWIVAIVDAFSRRIVAIRAFARVPTGSDVRAILRTAFQLGIPKYLLTDRGSQFKCDAVSKLCRRRGVLRRYGAVARWQSVAIIDRFFGSLKLEYASRWFVLLPLERVTAGLHRYTQWYNRLRPHQGLGGRVPDDVHFARPRRKLHGELRGVTLSYFCGDPKLPVYRRKLAA